MITPLMLLLSSINERLGYDYPVDTMYLNRANRTLILNEATRLGNLVSDDGLILMTDNAFGEAVCDTAQVINNAVVEVSPFTAVILTRLRRCFEVFKDSLQTAAKDESEIYDLDTDSVILRLEGNPRYIYSYVYSVMENNAYSYDHRIMQLAELYNVIVGFTASPVARLKQDDLVRRLMLQADLSFWQKLFYNDWIKRVLKEPPTLGMEDVEKTKVELKSMGFYGFVNPWKMYSEFSNSRINRKVELNVSEDVTLFLRKVVLSGGVNVV